jgi:hypothetical protein
MAGQGTAGPHYTWIALSNTTLGLLMATINSSIVLIALPTSSGASASTPSPMPAQSGMVLSAA